MASQCMQFLHTIGLGHDHRTCSGTPNLVPCNEIRRRNVYVRSLCVEVYANIKVKYSVLCECVKNCACSLSHAEVRRAHTLIPLQCHKIWIDEIALSAAAPNIQALPTPSNPPPGVPLDSAHRTWETTLFVRLECSGPSLRQKSYDRRVHARRKFMEMRTTSPILITSRATDSAAPVLSPVKTYKTNAPTSPACQMPTIRHRTFIWALDAHHREIAKACRVDIIF